MRLSSFSPYYGINKVLKDLAQKKFIYPQYKARDFLNPQPELATLVEAVPQGKNWIHETKYDGYRILSLVTPSRKILLSRNGKDWTHRFVEVSEGLKTIKNFHLVLDGELVVLDNKSHSSFSALQKALSAESKTGFRYYIFDLLFLNQYDLRPAPLLIRKQLLSSLFQSLSLEPPLYLSPFLQGEGEKFYKDSCRRGLEGMISKHALSAYKGGRWTDWQKVKCQLEEEFVIAGFTDPQGSRLGLGSLLLGYYSKEGKLIYAGRVGTGFNSKILRDLRKKFQGLELSQSPFAQELTWKEQKGVHYLKPKYVAQIRYTEWTAKEGRLRHPVFLGLREDKEAKEVTHNF